MCAFSLRSSLVYSPFLFSFQTVNNTLFLAKQQTSMSSSSDQNKESSDGKMATEKAAPGMNSITNTVGMHPSETTPEGNPSNVRHGGSCDQPGCTAEHSGKTHE